MVSDVLAPEPYAFLCLQVTKLSHCFHTSLAFSLRKPWNISISKPCAPTNRVKMTWNPIVIPITRVLVASSPSPHPKPNTMQWESQGNDDLLSDGPKLAALVSWSGSMLMGVAWDGGQDDDKHDPVEEVDQDKWKDEPKKNGHWVGLQLEIACQKIEFGVTQFSSHWYGLWYDYYTLKYLWFTTSMNSRNTLACVIANS